MSIALDSSSVIASATPYRESTRIGIKSRGSFLDAIDRIASQYENRTALRIQENGVWQELTFGALREDARRVSSWLIENGVTRGSTIALVEESRPEWTVALLAGMMSGAVVVPIDAKLTSGEIAVLLDHAAPQLVLTSRAMEATSRAAAARVTSVRGLIAIDGGADAGAVTFATIRAACPIRTHAPRRRDDGDTALVVYTSGTTGSPKGVETTFGNLHFQMQAMDKAIGRAGDERFLSVLPLNHLYELICGLLTPMQRGATITYSDSLLPDDVVRILREERITSLVGVPLLFRALKRGIERTVRQRGRLTEAWFSRTMELARIVPSYGVRRTMFAPVLKSFGPELRVFYSGGAALDSEVATFFERMGIPVYQGYGLSETSPVIATSSPSAQRLGSVGKPLEGVEVRIAKKDEADETGEILTRGPHLMSGYLRRPDLTREMIDDDGWLHTGDLGRSDEDGFLFVTGRSKDLIVLGGGKKVHPDEVEDVLGKSLLFKEVFVVGAPAESAMAKGFDEVCAVIIPEDALVATLQCKDVLAEALDAEIKSEVARLAKALAAFKRPTRILIRHEALPKTATRKLKRPLVLDWIRGQGGAERTNR